MTLTFISVSTNLLPYVTYETSQRGIWLAFYTRCFAYTTKQFNFLARLVDCTFITILRRLECFSRDEKTELEGVYMNYRDVEAASRVHQLKFTICLFAVSLFSSYVLRTIQVVDLSRTSPRISFTGCSNICKYTRVNDQRISLLCTRRCCFLSSTADVFRTLSALPAMLL